MLITAQQLIDAGAKCSYSFFWSIAAPNKYTVTNGRMKTMFDTAKMRLSVVKRLSEPHSDKTAQVYRDKSKKVLKSILKALDKVEKDGL